MMNTKAIDGQYVAHTYARFPVEIVGGHGAVVTDDAGKEYIDLGTGIAVNIFGMCDEPWITAVEAQLHRFQHTSNLYYTAPCAELAKMLCERTGLKRVFFGNSGAEANECAIKAARKYAMEKKGPEYSTIITLENSFHGRTLTTLAATGQAHYHELYQPLTPGFVHAKVDDLQSVKDLVAAHKVAGIMIEAVQGEGGVVPLSPEFARGIAEICEKEDIILVADEVQTGNGRSGALYAYMKLDISPDVVTTAKGIGGGLPLGVCMLGEKVKDIFAPGDHGSTFGGNPVACAGAISILSRIDDGLLAGVEERSKYIVETLGKCPGVESVSGMGLMLGVKTVKPAGEVVAACREQGVLVLTAKDRVRLLPPLNIPVEQLEKAVGIICSVCE